MNRNYYTFLLDRHAAIFTFLILIEGDLLAAQLRFPAQLLLGAVVSLDTAHKPARKGWNFQIDQDRVKSAMSRGERKRERLLSVFDVNGYVPKVYEENCSCSCLRS